MLKHQKHLQPRGQHSAEVVALRVEVFEKDGHCKVRTGDATNGEPGSAIKAIEDAGKRRAVASRNQRGQMRGYQYSRVGKEAEKIGTDTSSLPSKSKPVAAGVPQLPSSTPSK